MKFFLVFRANRLRLLNPVKLFFLNKTFFVHDQVVKSCENINKDQKVVKSCKNWKTDYKTVVKKIVKISCIGNEFSEFFITVIYPPKFVI